VFLLGKTTVNENIEHWAVYSIYSGTRRLYNGRAMKLYRLLCILNGSLVVMVIKWFRWEEGVSSHWFMVWGGAVCQLMGLLMESG
jgi:hypothetical protein